MEAPVVVAGGHHSLVAEHWWLKPKFQGLTTGGATFLSCPVAIAVSKLLKEWCPILCLTMLYLYQPLGHKGVPVI